MELAKLRYFRAVARLQHVTKAAEELHLAQPALTKAIKDLEEELGAPLFYKQGRGIRLTAQGKFLKEKLDNLLPALDELPTLLAEFDKREKTTFSPNLTISSRTVLISEAELSRTLNLSVTRTPPSVKSKPSSTPSVALNLTSPAMSVL